jgi:hypothetical protein
MKVLQKAAFAAGSGQSGPPVVPNAQTGFNVQSAVAAATSANTALKPPDPFVNNPDALAMEMATPNSGTIYTRNANGATQAEPFGPVQPHGIGSTVKSWFRSFVLPDNYPHSVHPDYKPFRMWHAVKNMCSSSIDYFTTQALVVGLGAHISNPIIAAISYGAKNALDGVGTMVGGKMAKKADQDPAKWYAYSQYVNAAGSLAQTPIMLFPGAFLPLSVTTNAAKAFAGSMQGAANANINLHQSLGQNVGELQAKNSNQDLISSGVGTVMGLGLSYVAKLTHPWVGPGAAAVFFAGAAFAAHRASKKLQMNDVSTMQLRRLVHDQLATDQLRTPAELAGEKDTGKKEQIPIDVGVGLEPFMHDAARFDQLRSIYKAEQYMLDYDGQRIKVALTPNASPADQARAVYQAQLVNEFVSSAGYQDLITAHGANDANLRAVETAYAATPVDFNKYIAALRDKGWDTGRIIIDSKDTRVRWKPGDGPIPPAISLAQFRQLMQGPEQPPVPVAH